MATLGLAISIAADAFKDTTDKGGKPYILHCLHVMNKLKYENDDELMIVGVLHDLIEDTVYTIEDLTKIGFSRRVTTLINLLTHKEGVDYMTYIEQIKSNSECAVKVKMQDLRHNSDILRMKGLREKDFKRLEKYHRAYNYLAS
jgi:(p)ppGpp synthase/HD superfamily hydrolase